MARSRKLANLIVKETSGVDHPAHLHEGWLVIKSSMGSEPETNINPEGENVELTVTESTPVANAVDAPSEDLRKELTDLRKELEAMRLEKQAIEAEREMAKAVESAQAWASLPGMDATTFAPILLSLRKNAPAEAVVIEDILTAAATALNESGIMNEVGSVGVNETPNAWDQVQNMANDLVRTGEAPSFAKAVALVATRNKDLYTAYINEKGM